jgi:transcriptional regulator with XRE-family HTH domain
MVENREIMAANIKYFMNQKKVNSMEVCKALGFRQNTFSDWINAKTYPRIDKIEKMANYFGVTKSDLVEERPVFVVNDLHGVVLTEEEKKVIKKLREMSQHEREFYTRMILYYELLKGDNNANR